MLLAGFRRCTCDQQVMVSHPRVGRVIVPLSKAQNSQLFQGLSGLFSKMYVTLGKRIY